MKKAPRIQVARASASEKKRARTIMARMMKEYGRPKCYLNFSSSFELLIGTILSAQCTDKKVNEVTPGLFKLYPDARAMAKAEPRRLEGLIKATGFFRAKARSIKAASQALVERHGGRVPGRMEDLVALPGVGRKTASVVLGNAFGVPAIAVDTHVLRVTERLGIASGKDANKMADELAARVPEKDWTLFSLLVTTHGRRICVAGKPFCSRCFLRDICPYRGPYR